MDKKVANSSYKKKVNKRIEKKNLYHKIMKYCAYQERSEYDVIEKLKVYHLNEIEISEIINKLKEENFINNQRFARVYAIGKFRNNRWGRIRIRYELKRKSFAEKEIMTALDVIDEEEYEKMILQLIRKKERLITNPELYIRQNKIVKFICSKGFEHDIVWDIVKKVIH